MPELPEVETSRRGIAPHIQEQTISKVIVRHWQLRWPIPRQIKAKLAGQTIKSVQRRGKYLLLNTKNGTAILHLGMSGSLRIVTTKTKPQKHDHVDIHFINNNCLRFNDPRRFGALLWVDNNPLQHELLIYLGPEPLSREFNGRHLWQLAQQKKLAVKNFIMNSRIVVGVGNIYANEALFMAGIAPQRSVAEIDLQQFNTLSQQIKKVLRAAIKAGGTTLKDFLQSDGKPGYFRHNLQVYGRQGLPCFSCETTLQEIRLGQRSTVFCPKCQASSQHHQASKILN